MKNWLPRLTVSGSGLTGWLSSWWRPALAELVSTALLVTLGVWATLPTIADTKLQPQPLAHAALAFGFVVLANVQVFGPVSGAHMNPAVSLAALLAGQLEPAGAALYVVAQCVGAVLGFALLQALAPTGLTSPSSVGCTLPGTLMTAVDAAGVEAVLTALLALLACALWASHDPMRPDAAVPIKFGLLVAGLIYAGGPLTGASLNPARSFGPALVQNNWRDHWVYWVGPLGGAALATLLHRFVLTPRVPASPTATTATPAVPVHETLPLTRNDTHC